MFCSGRIGTKQMMHKTKLIVRSGLALTVLLGLTFTVSPVAASNGDKIDASDTDADRTMLLHDNCEKVTNNGVAEKELQPAEDKCEEILTTIRDTARAPCEEVFPGPHLTYKCKQYVPR